MKLTHKVGITVHFIDRRQVGRHAISPQKGETMPMNRRGLQTDAIEVIAVLRNLKEETETRWSLGFAATAEGVEELLENEGCDIPDVGIEIVVCDIFVDDDGDIYVKRERSRSGQRPTLSLTARDLIDRGPELALNHSDIGSINFLADTLIG